MLLAGIGGNVWLQNAQFEFETCLSAIAVILLGLLANENLLQKQGGLRNHAASSIEELPKGIRLSKWSYLLWVLLKHAVIFHVFVQGRSSGSQKQKRQHSSVVGV